LWKNCPGNYISPKSEKEKEKGLGREPISRDDRIGKGMKNSK
jgi:hypothetical protein